MLAGESMRSASSTGEPDPNQPIGQIPPFAQELLLEQLPVIVWGMDCDLKFTFSVGGGLGMLGLTRNQLLGMTLYEYFGTESPEHPYVAPHLRSLQGESTSYEAEWQGRSYLVRNEPNRSLDGSIIGVIGIATDVTELKSAREAAQRAIDLMGVAAHDLRNHLHLIGLNIQQLGKLSAQEAPPGELVRKISERQCAQITRARTLLDRLFDVTTIASGELALELVEVDLAAIVRDVVDQLDEEFSSSGCRVLLSLDAAVGRWDRVRLEQLIENLLSNGAKFGTGKPIEVTVEAKNGWARLSVRDHGIGIASEDQARILGKFMRGATGKPGTGLGLWIVAKIVEAFAGRMRVESVLGAGSTFVVDLPLEGPAKPCSGVTRPGGQKPT